MPTPFRIRGSGVIRPTFAAELLRARDDLDTGRAVGLAMRAHRRVVGETQRVYAVRRGWSKTHQSRLESSADQVRLDQVMHALEGTGFELVLRRMDRDPDPQEVRAEDWPVTEVVALDGQGRRFPANRVVQRVREPNPQWWMARHGTNAMAARVEWTTTGE
ncbi:hypothetical protein BH24ACT8_BH24ACT8_12800 [soil metagenome]